MRRGSISPAPRTRKPGDEDFEKYPIKERFARLFVENFAERAAFGSTIHRVFGAMLVECNNDNLVQTSGLAIAGALNVPPATVYRILLKLEASKAVVKIKRGWWMIDPSLVYSGPSKYHRAVKMQFGIFSDKQPKENHATNHERNDDEQCDLQARSGDPDPARSDARAECA